LPCHDFFLLFAFCSTDPPHLVSHPTIHLRRFAHGVDSLLDLACGRGGDIHKWIDSGVGYVKGIDLSPGEVEEARHRYQQTLAGKRGSISASITACEFTDTPDLGIKEWKEPREYDVVTCMFALHYFFVSESALKQFLHNVSINLRPGGYFVGTVPDGKRINECIRSARTFQSPMLRIEARWQGTPATFGSPYICAIGDTVTGGEQGTEGSLEYLVYQNVLIGVAAQYGLRPVLDYGDAALEGCFDPGDKEKLLKHFAPYFPGSDPSLERASSLFTAFVFQKADDKKASDGGRYPQNTKNAETIAKNPATRDMVGSKRDRQEAGGEDEKDTRDVPLAQGQELTAAEDDVPSVETKATSGGSYKRPTLLRRKQ